MKQPDEGNGNGMNGSSGPLSPVAVPVAATSGERVAARSNHAAEQLSVEVMETSATSGEQGF